MNRFILILMGAALVMVLQFAANCSQPLESTDEPNNVPPGPDVIYDTTISIDTIVVVYDSTEVDTIIAVDTTIVADTVYVIDTTGQTDTVVVVVEGGDGAQTVCARLSSTRQEIMWMFRNEAGPFLLEFTAAAERLHPTQVLSVTVDGQVVEWIPGENRELILQQDLGENAAIEIYSGKPGAFGHAIDVCLTLTPLE